MFLGYTLFEMMLLLCTQYVEKYPSTTVLLIAAISYCCCSGAVTPRPVGKPRYVCIHLVRLHAYNVNSMVSEQTSAMQH